MFKQIMLIAGILIFTTNVLATCPTDLRRLDESYYYLDYLVIVDSFRMEQSHLFIVTYKGPLLSKGSVTMFFKNQTTRELLQGNADFEKINESVYRAYVIVANTEMYGKAHFRVTGCLAGKEGKEEVLYEKDMKLFLPNSETGCY